MLTGLLDLRHFEETRIDAHPKHTAQKNCMEEGFE